MVARVFARRLRQGSPITAAEGRRSPTQIVDGGPLLQVIWTSLAAGVGVTRFLSRSSAPRAGPTCAARGLPSRPSSTGPLALVAFAAVMALVVFGVIVMTSK